MMNMDLVHQTPRSFLPFGNPFRMILPKGSSLSPKLRDLLNAFEENLAVRFRKLKPAGQKDVLCLTWMKDAIELLCGIHADIKILITALDLPVCDWDDKWIDVYLDNSVKLLDICIGFSSEISQLKQGHLFLQCLLHDLDSASSKQFVKARSALDGWRDHMGSKNPRLNNIFPVMDSLARTLDLPKIKKSSRGRVLMRAMYGVKVATLFICSVLAAAFCGSAEKLIDLPVPQTCSWAQAFCDLQSRVNSEIRNNVPHPDKTLVLLKEVEAVEKGVRKVETIIESEVLELQKLKPDLGESIGEFSNGLDLLGKEVDSYFQVVLSGRDALLSNLRHITDTHLNVKGQVVR